MGATTTAAGHTTQAARWSFSVAKAALSQLSVAGDQRVQSPLLVQKPKHSKRADTREEPQVGWRWRWCWCWGHVPLTANVAAAAHVRSPNSRQAHQPGTGRPGPAWGDDAHGHGHTHQAVAVANRKPTNRTRPPQRPRSPIPATTLHNTQQAAARFFFLCFWNFCFYGGSGEAQHRLAPCRGTWKTEDRV
jgi:hypothetical protein